MQSQEHCKESPAFFGKPHEEVYKRLDEFQKAPGMGMKYQFPIEAL